jgi:hypothetical protein
MFALWNGIFSMCHFVFRCLAYQFELVRAREPAKTHLFCDFTKKEEDQSGHVFVNQPSTLAKYNIGEARS